MCGFAGLLAYRGHEDLRGTVARMTRSIAHRGPDAESVVSDGPIALGHRRLAIIDLSSSGAQPMQLRSGSAIVAYNGEIYNFRELRAELEGLGHRFTGGSDTEVLLRAFDEWGDTGLARLEGIFSYALWEPARRRLVLGRDRLGVKPLYYCETSAGIAFGSEIKAVRASGLADAALDPQALSEYLWFGTSFAERSIWRSVRSLEPGQQLVREDGRTQLRTWWRLEEWLDEGAFEGSERDAVEAVRSALDRSVARQLVADVPVAIFLSGGVDSSAIASAAARASERPLASFSVGFDYEHGVDELGKAKRVATALGLDHHEIRIAGDDIEQVLVRLVRAHDEPFADMANLPLYLMARALAGHYKVVLQGDGGDELFAGYRRYAVLAHRRAWRLVPWAGLGLLKRLRPVLGDRLSRMREAVTHPDADMRMALLLTTETLEQSPFRFFGGDVRGALERTRPFMAYEHAARRFGAFEPVQQMMLTDLTTQLPAQFLPKVDRATMAVGLEARVPLLDEQMVRLAVRLPWRRKVKGLQKKFVLREALRGRVADDILDAPKSGFGVPYEYWLRTKLHDFARDTVLAPGFCADYGIDRVALSKAFDEHRDGRKEHGWGLWKLFQLGLWARESTLMAGAGGTE